MGKVYADFVVELSSEATKVGGGDFQWVLYVDRSSNQQGSDADIILEGPNGLLIEQTLRFAFKANINQAEYDALIAGMLLAKESGAQSLLVKSDSLLVIVLSLKTSKSSKHKLELWPEEHKKIEFLLTDQHYLWAKL